MDEYMTHSTYEAIQNDIAAGQLDAARNAIQQLMQTQPQDAELWACESLYRMATSEWYEAEMALQQMGQFASPDQLAEVSLLRVRFSLATENTDGAIDAANEAIAQAGAPHAIATARFALAKATLAHIDAAGAITEEDSGEFDEYSTEDTHEALLQHAIEAMKANIADNQEAAASLSKIGALYELAKQFEEALESWEDARDLLPENTDVIHGVARNLERLEYLEDAYEAYQALYERESDDAQDQSTLLFSAEHFADAAQTAWHTLFEEWSLDAQPVRFDFQCDVYPQQDMLDESSPDELFDPRVGLHVAFIPDFTGELPTIQLIMYQRNIERDLEGDDDTSLSLALETLLEQCLHRVFSILDQDDEEEW